MSIDVKQSLWHQSFIVKALTKMGKETQKNKVLAYVEHKMDL